MFFSNFITLLGLPENIDTKMQRPPLSYHRSPLYYLLAATLIENAEIELEETRDITRRSNLRKKFNLQDINDTELQNRYHLSKEAFIFLCEQLRNKTSLKSIRISLELKVLCALSFYATGSYQHLLGMEKYLSQTAVSKCIRQVTDALISPAIMRDFITFPKTRADRDIIKNKFFAKFGFPGVIGCIGRCHFRILTPNKKIQYLFYCKELFHSLNVQMICDSDCQILNVNVKYGGATDDTFIWENSLANDYMQKLHRNNEEVWLLGDSCFPQRPWLMTPVPDAEDGTPAHKYTVLHQKIWGTIESTFEQVKNRWRCLSKDNILHYAPERCGKIITACCVLHNLAIRFNIPEP